MSEIQVRRFRRDNRVQPTALLHAHVAAVMPGVTVSVNTVLSQLERDPGEFIVDPWVGERLTLVAEQRQRQSRRRTPDPLPRGRRCRSRLQERWQDQVVLLAACSVLAGRAGRRR